MNPIIANQLAALLAELKNRVGIGDHVDGARLLQWPGLIEEEPIEMEGVFAAAMEVLERALDQLVAGRQREGARARLSH